MLNNLHIKALREHNNHLLYVASVVTSLVSVPFSIRLLLLKQHAPGMVMLLLALALIPNAVAIHQKQKPPIPFELIIVTAVFVLNVLLYHYPEQVYLTYWTYPAIVFTFTCFERAKALMYSCLFVVSTCIVITSAMGIEVAIRFFGSSFIVLIVLNIFVKSTNDLHYELLTQANRDPLTGVFNRNQMNVILEHAFHMHQRSRIPFSIMILDIDFFKNINDEYGHTMGDEVLKAFASMLQNNIRKSDVLFRVGGEEFMVLYHDTDCSQANELANKLRNKIAETDFVPNQQITASLGISELKKQMDVHQWYKAADDALYLAKNSGRNQVVIYDDMQIRAL